MISTPRSVSLPPWYQLFTEIRHWPRSKKSILDRSILREIFLLATWSVAWKRLALKKDSFPFRMPLWHLTRSSVQRAPQQILDIERSKINEISPIPPPPLIPRATFSVARQETHLSLRREDTFARITFHLFECSYPSFPFFLFPFLNLCSSLVVRRKGKKLYARRVHDDSLSSTVTRDLVYWTVKRRLRSTRVPLDNTNLLGTMRETVLPSPNPVTG